MIEVCIVLLFIALSCAARLLIIDRDRRASDEVQEAEAEE